MGILKISAGMAQNVSRRAGLALRQPATMRLPKICSRCSSPGLLFVFLIGVGLLTAFCSYAKDKRGPDDFKYFYIAFAFEGQCILDARPEDGAVVVRFIRIEPESSFCSGVQVRAMEARLANTRLMELTNGVDLCSIDENRADSALVHAKHKAQRFGHLDADGIVAGCKEREKLFRLPDTDDDEDRWKFPGGICAGVCQHAGDHTFLIGGLQGKL